MKKRLLSVLLGLCMAYTLFPTTVFATALPSSYENPINPYYYVVQDADGDGRNEIPCTEVAWQEAYNRLGVQLPAWGNAGTWLNSARNAGYSTGSTPRPNSIAVSTNGSYGHVAYVTEVGNGYIIVTDGGNTDNDGYPDYGYKVGKRDNPANFAGFIYLTNDRVSVSFSKWENSNYTYIRETDAAIGMTVSVSGGTPSYVGMILYDNSGNKLAQGGESNTYIGAYFFKINAELKYSLKHATTYKYRFFVEIDGKTYYSNYESFTTAGNHKYTTKVTAPTCTAQGYTTYTCACGNSYVSNYTKAKGHDYAVTVYAPTCTDEGYTSHACKNCRYSYQDEIKPALGHDYGKDGVCTRCHEKDPDYKAQNFFSSLLDSIRNIFKNMFSWLPFC